MTDDQQLAIDVARAAGVLLLELRERLASEGADPRTLKDEGDQQSHDLIVSRLGEARPDDEIRSEEDDLVPDVDHPRLWIVDPLDGTREFSEPPRDDWAVHVALLDRGELTAGAVALPAQDQMLAVGSPLPRPRPSNRSPRIAVSRSRPPDIAEAVASAVSGKLVPMGSAGAKAMAVVRGDVDAYVHAGGQYEWDSAAPVAVAHAAGFHASRLDGTPIVYGREDPWSPDLLVCRPALVDDILAVTGNA